MAAASSTPAAAGSSPAKQPPDLEVKLVILGNGFVGKSCLLRRFTDGIFPLGNMLATVGVDWTVRTVTLKPPPSRALAGGRGGGGGGGGGSGAAAEPAADKPLRVKLTIFDTAGQERFRSLATSYWRGADGIVLCYAVDSRETFEAIGAWLDDIEKSTVPASVPRVLVATKADLAESAADAVGADEGEELARRHGVAHFTTSAFTGAGVDAPFVALAQSVVDRGGGKRRGGHSAGASSGGGGGFGGGGGGGASVTLASAAAAAVPEPMRRAVEGGGAGRCAGGASC